MLKRLLILVLIVVILLLYAYDLTHLDMFEVVMLSLKGEHITWSDFFWLKGEDVGSGLYIMEYPINDSYCLRVSDSDHYLYRLFSKPMRVRLVSLDDGTWIDLIADNLWEFLFK